MYLEAFRLENMHKVTFFGKFHVFSLLLRKKASPLHITLDFFIVKV